MHRQARVVLFLLIASVLVASPLFAQSDPGIPDTVKVDSVSAYQSGIGVVPVRLYNDEPLSAIEITLVERSQSVIIDSFSFVGGRIATWGFKGASPSGDSILSIFGFTTSNSDLLPAGSGLVGKLYISYSSNITPQDVPIDSITFSSQGVEKSVTLTGSTPQAFKPKFRRGHLTIMESPVAMDSIWVDTVKIGFGQSGIVDVNMYNERAVQTVAIALKYGSSYLTFDSASFLNTRGLTATTRTVNRNDAGKEMLISLDFSTPLDPGTGKIARLYFTTSPSAADTTVVIDSTTYLGFFKTKTKLTAADGNTEFTPFFRSGWIHITTVTGVTDNGNGTLPKSYSLSQNYPNPFNPSTTIEFALPTAGKVQLDVFNMLGQRVRTLVSDELSAGNHHIVFDGRGSNGNELASGVYFYRLSTEKFTQTKKMLMVK